MARLPVGLCFWLSRAGSGSASWRAAPCFLVGPFCHRLLARCSWGHHGVAGGYFSFTRRPEG
eukprot:scaffold206258_cov12-Tisochrysis_lutea.AAC.1